MKIKFVLLSFFVLSMFQLLKAQSLKTLVITCKGGKYETDLDGIAYIGYDGVTADYKASKEFEKIKDADIEKAKLNFYGKGVLRCSTDNNYLDSLLQEAEKMMKETLEQGKSKGVKEQGKYVYSWKKAKEIKGLIKFSYLKISRKQ